MSILMFFSFNANSFAMVYNLKSVNFNLGSLIDKTTEDVSIYSDSIPKEVKERIEILKKDKNVKNIQLQKSEYNIEREFENNNLITFKSWGNPYKGYKNLYFKDWIIRTKENSKPTTIREDKWGKIADDNITNVVSSAIGLLIGGVNSIAGTVYTVAELLSGFIPKSVTTSTKVKFSAILHVDEKIEKHTYVREGSTGAYEYGALTQKAKFKFENLISIPGKKIISNFTPYRIVETQNFSKPDRKAWNAVYNPWVERLKSVNYGGVNFSL